MPKTQAHFGQFPQDKSFIKCTFFLTLLVVLENTYLEEMVQNGFTFFFQIKSICFEFFLIFFKYPNAQIKKYFDRIYHYKTFTIYPNVYAWPSPPPLQILPKYRAPKKLSKNIWTRVAPPPSEQCLYLDRLKKRLP